jgi:hypothetical protein
VAVAFLPGAIWSIPGLTPELLALGFAALAIAAFEGERPRPLLGAMLLVAAALTRETMLFVVLGLAAWAWFHRDRRMLLACAAPVVAFAAVAGLIAARVGTFTAHGNERFSAVPFQGLVDGFQSAQQRPVVVLTLVLAIVLIGSAIAMARSDPLTWAATAYLVLLPFLGEATWSTRDAAARTLLPALAFAGVVVIARVFPSRRGSPIAIVQ